MIDILGNSLKCGDKVVVLSNIGYEGTYCLRDSWDEVLGIVIGENEVFIKRLYNHKQKGYKIIKTDEVFLVTQSSKKYENEFSELQVALNSYFQNEVATSNLLTPGTVFKNGATDDLYVYLGNLKATTCMLNNRSKLYDFDYENISGRLCINARKLINLNGKTMRSKDLYDTYYNFEIYLDKLLRFNNSNGLISKGIYNMDSLGITVGKVLGVIKLDNIYIDSLFVYGGYGKQLRLRIVDLNCD